MYLYTYIWASQARFAWPNWPRLQHDNINNNNNNSVNSTNSTTTATTTTNNNNSNNSNTNNLGRVFSPDCQASSFSVLFPNSAFQLEQCTFKRLFDSESATGKVTKSTD